MLTTVLPFLCILPPLAYGVIALGCARSYFGRRRPAPGHTPPISILKPVKGMDAGSFDNFASFCRQEYPAPWQIVFAVADPADPVIPVIGRLMGEFPAIDMELVVDATIHGPNHKVSNLINACPKAKHDLLIVCDSDIRVSPDYLREVAAPFADQQVGLVTSLYRSPGVAGAATAVEAMGFTVEMIPNVMVAMKLEGLSFALGASMAVRREALEAIGGFAALADYLPTTTSSATRSTRWGGGWNSPTASWRASCTGRIWPRSSPASSAGRAPCGSRAPAATSAPASPSHFPWPVWRWPFPDFPAPAGGPSSSST